MSERNATTGWAVLTDDEVVQALGMAYGHRRLDPWKRQFIDTLCTIRRTTRRSGSRFSFKSRAQRAKAIEILVGEFDPVEFILEPDGSTDD